MRTITTYVLVIPGRPISINKPMHYQRWAEETKKWRIAAKEAAEGAGVPRLEKVKITACPWLKGKREQDVGACVKAVKGAVDGIVDAGVLEDDTAAHMLGLNFLPPVLGAEADELVLTLEEVA